MTKAESETTIRSHLDDLDSKRWPAAEFDLIVSATYDSMWRRLLVQFPWYLVQTDTITSQLASPGYVVLTTAGDLTQRFHALRHVTRDGREYSEIDRKNVAVEGTDLITGEDYSYFRLGDRLYLLPFDQDTDVEVEYGYMPAAWSGLADGTAITWPEGHELAFTLGAATRLGLKGGVEDMAQLGQMAALEWNSMLESLKAATPGGVSMFVNDRAEGWGSVG